MLQRFASRDNSMIASTVVSWKIIIVAYFEVGNWSAGLNNPFFQRWSIVEKRFHRTPIRARACEKINLVLFVIFSPADKAYDSSCFIFDENAGGLNPLFHRNGLAVFIFKLDCRIRSIMFVVLGNLLLCLVYVFVNGRINTVAIHPHISFGSDGVFFTKGLIVF